MPACVSWVPKSMPAWFSCIDRSMAAQPSATEALITSIASSVESDMSESLESAVSSSPVITGFIPTSTVIEPTEGIAAPLRTDAASSTLLTCRSRPWTKPSPVNSPMTSVALAGERIPSTCLNVASIDFARLAIAFSTFFCLASSPLTTPSAALTPPW